MFALHRSLSLGYLRLHPTRAVLIVLSIALGVATLVATRMLNQSINQEAPEAVNPLAKIADLVVMNAQTGVLRTLADEIQKANIPGVRLARPVVLGRITLPQLDKSGRSVWLFGLDWSAKDLQRPEAAAADWGVAIQWSEDPTTPGGIINIKALEWAGRIPVLIGDKLAQDLRAHASGDPQKFQALAASHTKTLSSIGTVRFTDVGTLKHGNFVVMDVGAAAELIFPQRKENVSQINIRLADGADRRQVIQLLQQFVGDRAVVRTLETNYAAVRDVTGGLELGFDIGGALALVIGLFLVYNVLSVSVAERRHDIGILRSVGATRLQVAGLFLGEAALLGLVGSALGLPIGWGLALLILSPLLGFLSDVFVPMSGTSLQASAALMQLALAAGISTAMLAALVPALQAASEEPAAAVRRVPRTGRLRHRILHLSAIALLVLAGVGSVIGREHLPRRWGVFAGAVLLFVAAIVLIPLATELLGRLLRPLVRSFLGMESRLAADNLVSSPVRTGIVIAALAATAGLFFGLASFIHSTKSAVYTWIDNRVAADLFVTCGGSLDAASLTQPMDARLGDKLRSLPEVELAMGVRFHLHDYGDRIVFMLAVDTGDLPEQSSHPAARYLDKYRGLRRGGTALISDNFAALYGKHAGDRITLRGRNGPIELEVIGTRVDYTWNRGTILVDRAWYRKEFGDDLVDIWDIYLRQGANAEAVRDRIQANWGHKEALYAATRAQMHKSIEDGIERLYALGYAQFVIVGLVTLLGVVSALFISVLQRRRELGLLRAVGASRGQILGTVLAEALLMGLFGAVIGALVGLFIEWYTIRFILLDEAGFVFPLMVAWRPAAGVCLLAVLLATLVGLWPAYHATRLRIAEAIAYE